MIRKILHWFRHEWSDIFKCLWSDYKYVRFKNFCLVCFWYKLTCKFGHHKILGTMCACTKAKINMEVFK